jgi:hypothetical protein
MISFYFWLADDKQVDVTGVATVLFTVSTCAFNNIFNVNCRNVSMIVQKYKVKLKQHIPLTKAKAEYKIVKFKTLWTVEE